MRISGAEGQSRTADTLIFSQVLYHLSYLGNLAEQPNSRIAPDQLSRTADHRHRVCYNARGIR
jgi:hypothetical protein